MASRKGKKEKFVQPQKKNTGLFLVIGIVAVIVIGAGIYFFQGDSGSIKTAINVGAVDYSGQKLDFVEVNAAESGGDIVFSLDDVKNNKTVTFDVPGISFSLGNGSTFNYLPLLSYVTPAGDVVVAISLCEPCSGTSFHVDGKDLVCNSCGTRWRLDSLKGISGGCTQYPPESIEYSVDGNNLIIKKADLLNWQPRPV